MTSHRQLFAETIHSEEIDMKVQLTLIASMLTTIYACGANERTKSKILESTEIPSAAIIAVSDGGEDSSLSNLDDLRSITGQSKQAPIDQIQDQDLPKLHQQAQQAETILNQEQALLARTNLRGWFHYRRCPSQVFRITVETQQEPVILDSCQSYQQYEPIYMLRGKAHRFFFQRAHRLQNTTYYYYVSTKQEVTLPSQSQSQSTDQSVVQSPEPAKKTTEQSPEQNDKCQKEKRVEQTQKGKSHQSC